jgi:hypothetical protein
VRPGELRLEPQEETLEGYGRECALRVYESSLMTMDRQRLLTIVSGGNGLRLTKAQVDELIEYLTEWRGAHPA